MHIIDHNSNKRSPHGAGLRRRDQRGVALLLTIFGLLLLTALAAAMMFSSDAETAISVNYRDSQVASYAAASGVEEARDRIQPVFGDLALAGYLPTNTPDQGIANGGYVLYIVNPNTVNKETVASIAPWNWNNGNNPYFDSELCQEGMLGITRGTAGVACSGATNPFPSNACTDINGGGANWCRYYDNSTNATNWQLKDTNGNPIPLDYKWVRITMKEDWNTPVYVPSAVAVNGAPAANGTQVCWDGNYQTQMPANYNAANCQPTGANSVIGLNLTAAGAGFATAPTVAITGGGGSGATATAQITPAPSDGIASVVITAGGSGYTSPPTVTISPSGATFQAVVASSAVTGVSINNSSSDYCYTTGITPTVTFATIPATNTISNATAAVTMNNGAGCITAVSTTGTCKNTTAGKSYTITSGGPSGGGSGFSGTVTFTNGSGKVNGITVTGAGSGYKAGASTIGITDDKGASCTFGPTFSVGSQISTITVAAGNGGAYMSQPTATLGGSSPAAPSVAKLPALTALPNPWSANASAITSVNVTTPGTGYTPGTHYPLTFTGGGGTGAAGYAVGGGTFVVSALNLTNGGGGYTSAPTVTISGGGGTGATGTATIGSGTNNTAYGQVYLLTAFAMTKNGSKSMAQMETGARPPFYLNIGGAITLAGSQNCGTPANPTPCSSFPNSNNFTVNGNDAAGTEAADPATCSAATASNKPAVGVYDSQSQNLVANSLQRPINYSGVGGCPTCNPPQASVEVAYAALGGADLTPDSLYNYLVNLQGYATNYYTGSVSSLPATTTSSVTFVNGDLTLSGNPSGSGILVVTGDLTFSGNFNWNGIVLIVGQGNVLHNGGGNMYIDGAIYVAQITKTGAGFTQNNLLSQMSDGNPIFTWNGGGTNQVQYDHCLADGLLQKYNTKPSSKPLQVLSERTLNF
jgi:hypothetical protein